MSAAIISDPYWRAVEEAAAIRAGRPANSPDWGMLVAVKSGTFVSERDPADRAEIKAGVTRVSPDYWLAHERPELFKLGNRRDARTYRIHCRNLELTRQELERGRPTRPPYRRSVLSRGVLPPRGYTPVLPRKAEPWRLPR